MLRRLLSEGKITEEIVTSWRRSGCSANQRMRLEAEDREGIERLIE